MRRKFSVVVAALSVSTSIPILFHTTDASAFYRRISSGVCQDMSGPAGFPPYTYLSCPVVYDSNLADSQTFTSYVDFVIYSNQNQGAQACAASYDFSYAYCGPYASVSAGTGYRNVSPYLGAWWGDTTNSRYDWMVVWPNGNTAAGFPGFYISN